MAISATFSKNSSAPPPAPLEKIEKLEQLRALHIGGRIRILQTHEFGIGIDTPEDVIKAEQLIQEHNIP